MITIFDRMTSTRDVANKFSSAKLIRILQCDVKFDSVQVLFSLK